MHPIEGTNLLSQPMVTYPQDTNKPEVIYSHATIVPDLSTRYQSYIRPKMWTTMIAGGITLFDTKVA